MDWNTLEAGLRASDRYNKVIKIFEGYRFKRILDIGGGTGELSLLLGKSCNASEVYCIDILEEAVEIARSRGIKALTVNVDKEPLPFEMDSLDAIFCGEVIEHLLDPDHLLDEIFRVLKPNGIAVLTTPNLAVWYNRIVMLFGFQPFHTHTGYRWGGG